MRRCSLFASSAVLAVATTANALQNKTMRSIAGGFFSKKAEASLQEAAQTRGYTSPLWLTKEAAMGLRCYGGLQEGALPVRVGDRDLYNIEQTVHPNAHPMRSFISGKIYPGRLQEVLSKHAKERSFQSPLWVTADQLKKSETEIVIKKDEQPIEIRDIDKNEMTHFYNLSQVADVKSLYDFKTKYEQKFYEVKCFIPSPTGPASVMTGKPFPKEQQRLLAQAAKKKGLTSRYWVTRKQLAFFTPPLTLKEDAEPIEVSNGKEGEPRVTYSIYNVDQIVEGDVVAEHLAAMVPPSSSS